MTESALPPPAEPAPEPAPEPRAAEEASSLVATPRAAPAPAKHHKRSAFRRRDELGLLILGLGLTIIVWTIARQAVIKDHDVLESVRVVWVRAQDSDLDVVFTSDDPTVSVQLKCSDPDYQEYSKKLLADGLRLRIGALNESTNERELSENENDGYVLPFHPNLLAGRKIALPPGQVVRVERGRARLVAPDLSKLTSAGVRVEWLETEPETFELANVRANLFREPIKPDAITIDDLRLDESLGADGIRWVVPSFKDWTGESKQAPDRARITVRRTFPPVRIKLRVFGGEVRAIPNTLRWVLSDDDVGSYDFRIGGDAKLVGIDGKLFAGTLQGSKEELAWVAAHLDRWHWAISIFGQKLPGAAADPTTETPLVGTVDWVHDDDPRFAGVQFIPTTAQKTDIVVLVKRAK